jgi:small GTP-binding protein
MSFLDRLGQKLGRLVDDIAMPDAIRADLEHGKAALESGDLKEAEVRFRRATNGMPDYGQAFYLLGLSLLRQNRPTPAIAALNHALVLDGDDFTVLLALAEAHRAQGGDMAPAISAYKRALSCKAKEQLLDRVYGGLGEIYLKMGEVDRAVRELRKAVAVSEGKDLRLLGLLGLAQKGDRAPSLARQSLARAAAAVPADPAVLLGLVDVSLELGQLEEARLAALRLVQDRPNDEAARCALARCLLATGDVRGAHQELLQALQANARSFEAHRLLAKVHLQTSAPQTAIDHLRTALSLEIPTLEQGTDTRRELLALELEAGTDPDDQETERLLQGSPDDPLGLACRSLASRDRGLVARSLSRIETYEGRLAQALVELTAEGGDLQAAAMALRAGLRLDPRGRRARQLLGEVYDRMSGLPDGPLSFYPALRRIHGLLVSQPALTDLGTEVARIQEVFDRPLLVVVLGEFNTGKSTFVNALIGEKAAPMGVTPTTATINVLKYGERRGARVVWRDDREEELAWERVPGFLKGLDHGQAREIRIVELLYPSEELLRVNIVDTPGLNSMIDEHEETAREFMTQADAVVWLFSADQAGKQTEQQALALLKQHRLKTVGVLNKVDRLSAADLSQVLEHLDREFSELVEAIVPVSARAALDALVSSDGGEAKLQESRFPELRGFLEQQIFARSRRIKRDVCQRRLNACLAEVEERSQAVLVAADQAVGRIDESRAELRAKAADEKMLTEERERLRETLQLVYKEGAGEVLDFVRPRRWVFGEHRATAADRDFLLDLLMEGLGQMGEASARRVSEQLTTVGKELRSRLEQAFLDPSLASAAMRLEALDRAIPDHQNLLRQQVYGQYRAYVRGYLQGGRVDSFFEHRLPRLALDADAIFDALMADSVDLELELLSPLRTWLRGTLEDLGQQLTRIRTEVDLIRLQQDRQVLTPLLDIQRRLNADPEGDRAPVTP